jgi:hypothetical protein
MQYNTYHNRKIKLTMTILQKYSTGLHKLIRIETKFEFKFKLQTKIK